MSRRPNDFAAALLDHLRHAGHLGLPHGIVGQDEEPGVLALPQPRPRNADTKTVGVMRPMNMVGTAKFTGQIIRGGGRHHQDLVPLFRQRRQTKRHRRQRDVDDAVDTLGIEPATGNPKAEIRFELEVADKHLDRYLWMLLHEIRSRQSHRGNRPAAGQDGIGAVEVAQRPDAQCVSGIAAVNIRRD